MSDQKAQSSFEKIWAQAFVDYLNFKNKSDYSIVNHNNNETPEWADVDIKAISTSDKFPSLYLQLTRDDRLDRIIRDGKHSVPVFNCDNILQAISDKEKKYLKNGKDFSKITLLIQGTLSQSSVPFELTDDLCRMCTKSSFKQIYYSSAPALVGSPKGQNHFEDWFFKGLKL